MQDSLGRVGVSWLAIGSIQLLFIAGCAGEYESIEMQGSVRVDGVAASAGYITFAPDQHGKGRGGICQIGHDGTYVLDRVPIGRVTFSIAPQEKTGKQVATSDPTGNQLMTEEVLPMIPGGSYGRGQVTVTLDVTESMATYDFELTRDRE